MRLPSIQQLLVVLALLGLSLSCEEAPPLALNNVHDPSGTTYVPNGPTGLVVTGRSDTLTSLAWVDNSIGEDGFLIQRRTEGASFESLTVTGVNQTSFDDRSVHLTGLSYYYRVCAVREGRKSAYTQEAGTSILFPPPYGLDLFSTPDSVIRIQWYSSSPLEEAIEVDRSIDGGGYSLLTTLSGVSSYVDHSVSRASRYSYRVRAVGAHNTSAYSDPVEAQWLLDNAALASRGTGAVFFNLAPSADVKLAGNWGGSEFCEVEVWNVETGTVRCVTNFRNPSGVWTEVVDMQMSPDASLFSATVEVNFGTRYPQFVSLNRTTDAGQVRTFSDNLRFTGTAFHPDGQRFLTTNENGPLRIWDISTGNLVSSYPLEPGWRLATVHPSGSSAILVNGSGYRTVDLGSGSLSPVVIEREGINYLAYSRDATELIITAGPYISRRNAGGELIASYQAPPGIFHLRYACTSPNGYVLALSSWNIVLAWSGINQEYTYSLSFGQFTSIVLLPGRDRILGIWPPAGGFELWDLRFRWSKRAL